MRRIHLYQKRVYNRNKITGNMISSTFNKSFNANSILPELGGMTIIKSVNKSNCTKLCNNNQKNINLDCKFEYFIDLSDNTTDSKLSADEKFINLINVIPKGENTSVGIVDNIYVSNIYWQELSNPSNKIYNLDCIECSEKANYVKYIRVILVIDDKNCSKVPLLSTLSLTAGLVFNFFRIAYNPLSAGPSHSKSKFRRPIGGFRKAYAECDNMSQNKWSDGKNIYADNYAKCKEKRVCDYDCCGNVINTAVSRTNYPVIRSGMLERKDRQQFRSYRDYLHNGVLASYERSLEKNRMDTTAGSNCVVFNKSVQCCDKPTGSCNCNISKRCSGRVLSKTIFKPNNKKFQVQGAVSSGSRLDRLKLDTIRKADANKVRRRKGGLKNKKTCNCTNPSCTDCGSANGKCSNFVGTAPYFAGKPRFTGWIYNNLNKENRCNQRARPSPFGIPQHQKYRANSTYKLKGKISC
tara:strand:+ start:50 stop:1447 length:1398 start_codon:yes stop_codon:yes gene_type:complete